MSLMEVCMTVGGRWKLILILRGSLYVIIWTSLELSSSALQSGNKANELHLNVQNELKKVFFCIFLCTAVSQKTRKSESDADQLRRRSLFSWTSNLEQSADEPQTA